MKKFCNFLMLPDFAVTSVSLPSRKRSRDYAASWGDSDTDHGRYTPNPAEAGFQHHTADSLSVVIVIIIVFKDSEHLGITRGEGVAGRPERAVFPESDRRELRNATRYLVADPRLDVQAFIAPPVGVPKISTAAQLASSSSAT